ncbi:hypothetical protein ACFY19_21225 [Streptosporangium saharense]
MKVKVIFVEDDDVAADTSEGLSYTRLMPDPLSEGMSAEID